jgi:hypothetical protein
MVLGLGARQHRVLRLFQLWFLLRKEQGRRHLLSTVRARRTGMDGEPAPSRSQPLTFAFGCPEAVSSTTSARALPLGQLVLGCLTNLTMGANADARLGVILVASRLAMETRRAILSAHAVHRVMASNGRKSGPG